MTTLLIMAVIILVFFLFLVMHYKCPKCRRLSLRYTDSGLGSSSHYTTFRKCRRTECTWEEGLVEGLGHSEWRPINADPKP